MEIAIDGLIRATTKGVKDNVAITEKYIVKDRIQLSSEAMAFFA